MGWYTQSGFSEKKKYSNLQPKKKNFTIQQLPVGGFNPSQKIFVKLDHFPK